MTSALKYYFNFRNDFNGPNYEKKKQLKKLREDDGKMSNYGENKFPLYFHVGSFKVRGEGQHHGEIIGDGLI